MIDSKNREVNKNDRRELSDSPLSHKNGREIRVTFMIDEELVEKLKKIAESKNCLVKDEVNLALQERILNHKREQPVKSADTQTSEGEGNGK